MSRSYDEVTQIPWSASEYKRHMAADAYAFECQQLTNHLIRMRQVRAGLTDEVLELAVYRIAFALRPQVCVILPRDRSFKGVSKQVQSAEYSGPVSRKCMNFARSMYRAIRASGELGCIKLECAMFAGMRSSVRLRRAPLQFLHLGGERVDLALHRR